MREATQQLPPGWRIKVLPASEKEPDARLVIQAPSGKSVILFPGGDIVAAVFAELGDELETAARRRGAP